MGKAGRRPLPTPLPGKATSGPLLGPGRPPGSANPAPVSPCPARVVQSPKRMSLGRGGRDRFTAESYTVLGERRGAPGGEGGLGNPGV